MPDQNPANTFQALTGSPPQQGQGADGGGGGADSDVQQKLQQIVNMSPEQREQLAAVLAMSGVLPPPPEALDQLPDPQTLQQAQQQAQGQQPQQQPSPTPQANATIEPPQQGPNPQGPNPQQVAQSLGVARQGNTAGQTSNPFLNFTG